MMRDQASSHSGLSPARSRSSCNSSDGVYAAIAPQTRNHSGSVRGLPPDTPTADLSRMVSLSSSNSGSSNNQLQRAKSSASASNWASAGGSGSDLPAKSTPSGSPHAHSTNVAEIPDAAALAAAISKAGT